MIVVRSGTTVGGAPSVGQGDKMRFALMMVEVTPFEGTVSTVWNIGINGQLTLIFQVVTTIAFFWIFSRTLKFDFAKAFQTF